MFGLEWLASGGHRDPQQNHPSAEFTAQHPRYQSLIQSESRVVHSSQGFPGTRLLHPISHWEVVQPILYLLHYRHFWRKKPSAVLLPISRERSDTTQPMSPCRHSYKETMAILNPALYHYDFNEFTEARVLLFFRIRKTANWRSRSHLHWKISS